MSNQSALERLSEDAPKILKHWGPGLQVHKAIEEMAELTQVLAKPIHKKDRIQEEIADAMIMLYQMRDMFGGGEVDACIHKKLDRTFERIKVGPMGKPQ